MTVDMDGLTPDTRSAWDDFVSAAKQQLGFDLVPRSARRTCAEQAEQWAIGRSGSDDTRTPTTHAKGCRSWHVLGRAVDFFVYVNGVKSTMSADYATAGEFAEGLGWVWGGRFSGFGPNGDEGHVEWHPGLSIDDACPNADVCVDIASSSPPSAARSAWRTVGIVFGSSVLIGLAVLGGAHLAKRA